MTTVLLYCNCKALRIKLLLCGCHACATWWHRRFKAINQILLNREASGQKLDMEAERRLRSPEEMSAEAAELRKAMSAFDQ